MKRVLLVIAAVGALALAMPTSADAQFRGGHGAVGGGGFGGRAAIGGGGGGGWSGGGGAFRSSGPISGAGGASIYGGAGVSSFARTAPSGRAFAAVPNGGQRFVEGGTTVGGQRFVQGNIRGNVQGNIQANRVVRRDFDRRRHRRGFAFFGAFPYDDGYYDYAYADSCYELRLIGGVWRQVYVCDDNAY